MNHAFKTVWSGLRGQYVVTDEKHRTHGKPTKTLAALAVASVLTLGSAAAMASTFNGTITNDNLPTIGEDGRETTKLVVGNGNKIDIQTDGSVSELLDRIQNSGSMGMLDRISYILGPSDDLSHVVITGVTGGSAVMNQGVGTILDLAGKVKPDLGPWIEDVTSVFEQVPAETFKQFEGDTSIQIGSADKTSSPIVIGSIGGDLSIATSTSRVGSAHTTVSSGNVAGIVGGSMQVGFTHSDQPFVSDISATEVTIDGYANAAGIVAGGAAVGIGQSNVASMVTGSTSLTIDMADDADAGKLDGIVVGAMGGSLSAATGATTAASSAGAVTTIDVQNGTVGMLIGGGAAVAFDMNVNIDLGDSWLINAAESMINGKFKGAGTASATSGAIGIHLGEATTTAGVLGGGLAIADAYGENVADSTASAQSVTITLDGGTITEEQKTQVHHAFYGLANAGSSLGLSDLTTFLGDVSVDGVHLGTLGGGAAVARGSFESGATGHAMATSTVETVSMTLNGGYNVGVIGGGAAVGWDKVPGSVSPEGQISAQSTVGTSTIAITGGENVLVLGGGLSYVTGNNGHNTFASADAAVETANLFVTGGSVDGLIGGGMAWDDTNASETNASVTGGTVNIVVEGGTVNALNADPFRKFGSVGDDLADALDASGAAIVGGGIALGHGAASTIDNVNITVAGGTVTGNIVAGGLTGASQNTLANTSTVKNAVVTISEAAEFTGTKIDASTVTEKATLALDGAVNLVGTDDKPVTIAGFTDFASTGEASLGTVDFAGRESATFKGLFNVNALTAQGSEALNVASGALALTTFNSAVHYSVTDGVLALGDQADASAAYESAEYFDAIPSLVLSGTVDLTGATIAVGDVSDTASGVTIGENGSLIADAGAKTDVTGSITAEGTHGIYFTGVAEEGAKVTFGQNGLTGFDLNDLVVDNIRYEAKNENNTFTFSLVSDAGKLEELGLDGFDAQAFSLIEGQDDPASRYIRGLLDGANAAISDGDHRHAQLNAAFNLAAAAGVQTASIESAMLGIDQIAKRASLANKFADGWTGFAEIAGTQADFGGDRGALETSTKLYGVAVGGEYTAGDWTFGVLANIGTGDVEGQGDNDGADNDVDYYGVSGYAARRLGAFNLVGQLGWSMTSNDVTHDSGDKADIDADVFTVGARGEWAWSFNDTYRAVPYVGVNYLRVSTDGYKTDLGFEADDADQDLVNLPIGVTFAGTFTTQGGWSLRPTADIAYVHTFGDTDVDVDTTVGAAVMSTNLDVWSEDVGRVRLGLEAGKDNFAFGFTLGGAVGDADYTEVYGQLHAKYLF